MASRIKVLQVNILEGLEDSTLKQYIVQVEVDKEGDRLPYQIMDPSHRLHMNFIDLGFEIVDIKRDHTNTLLAFYQGHGFRAVNQGQTDFINTYRQ